jgi:hypothetical protein
MNRPLVVVALAAAFACGSSTEPTSSLTLTFYVTGVVSDTAGTPIEGAKVGTWGNYPPEILDANAVITDQDGRFQWILQWPLSCRDEITHYFGVEHPDYKTLVELGTLQCTDERQTANFELRPISVTWHVTGIVSSTAGVPIEGAKVHTLIRVYEDSVYTDHEGRYRWVYPLRWPVCEGVDTTHIWSSVLHPDFRPLVESVTLRCEDEWQTVDFELAPI